RRMSTELPGQRRIVGDLGLSNSGLIDPSRPMSRSVLRVDKGIVTDIAHCEELHLTPGVRDGAQVRHLAAQVRPIRPLAGAGFKALEDVVAVPADGEQLHLALAVEHGADRSDVAAHVYPVGPVTVRLGGALKDVVAHSANCT